MIIKKKTDKINQEQVEEKQVSETEEQSLESEILSSENINLFDLDNIEFSQRQERRRGDRRRGYRRIDDRNLVSRAQEEAMTIKENAKKEGYEAGLQQAQADVSELKSIINNFVDAKEEVFERIAPDLLEISVEIAKKIVKKEIDEDPQLLLNSILEVLKTLSPEESKITIIVNPSQVELAKIAVPEITNELGLHARLTINSDDTIEIGGCIIQTSNGIVDATINTQLEIVKEAFKGM
ncbi:MAG: hypothetical protein MJ229_05625 [bacterium]|nr:hypothetical protein [bacterium]